MQAIRTKYIGPTDTRGGRIAATCQAGRIVMGYDHSVSSEQAHRAVAEALVAKLCWNTDYYGPLVGGCLPDGSYAWVFRDLDVSGI